MKNYAERRNFFYSEEDVKKEIDDFFRGKRKGERTIIFDSFWNSFKKYIYLDGDKFKEDKYNLFKIGLIDIIDKLPKNKKENKKKEKKIWSNEVEELFELFKEEFKNIITENKFSRNKTAWKEILRKMIDYDGEKFEEIKGVISFASQQTIEHKAGYDGYYYRVESIPTFRKKYRAMRDSLIRTSNINKIKNEQVTTFFSDDYRKL